MLNVLLEDVTNLYFHTWDDNGTIMRQGQILEHNPDTEKVKVVWFSWTSGEENGEEELDGGFIENNNVTCYRTAEAMNNAWEQTQ